MRFMWRSVIGAVLVSTPAFAIDTTSNDGSFVTGTIEDALLDESPVSLSVGLGPAYILPLAFEPRIRMEGPAASLYLSAGRWINRHLCLTGELAASLSFQNGIGGEATVGPSLLWNVVPLFSASATGMTRLELGLDLSFAVGVVGKAGTRVVLEVAGGIVARYRVSPHVALGVRTRTWLHFVGDLNWPLHGFFSIEWLL